MFNVQEMTSRLATMGDADLQKVAQLHKADPYMLPLVLGEANRRKAVRMSASAQQGQPPQGSVVDRKIAEMSPMPEHAGIGQLPAPAMQGMAGGGIVGFSKGGKTSGASLLDEALRLEGVTDPKEIAFIKALHLQESGGGGAETATSNRGAKGPMQVTDIAFKDVNKGDLNPDDVLDRMRAGVRYARKGLGEAEGDPVLAGAHYYGGPTGLAKLRQGVAVTDPVNPQAPDTKKYGQSVASRMAALLPMGTANAGEAATTASAPEQTATFMPSTRTVWEQSGKDINEAMGAGNYGVAAGHALRRWLALGPAVAHDVTDTPAKLLKKGSTGIASALRTAATGDKTPFTYDTPTTPQAPKAAPEAPQVYDENVTAAYRDSSRAKDLLPQDNAPAPTDKEAIAVAKEAIPAKERKGWDKDDLLTLGLNLMANKSRSFLGAVGEAGLATLSAKQAREKQAMADRLNEAHAGYYERAGKASDRVPDQIQLLEYLRKNPEAAAQFRQMQQEKQDPKTRQAAFQKWSGDVLLQMKYPNFEDYLRIAPSAASATPAAPNIAPSAGFSAGVPRQ